METAMSHPGLDLIDALKKSEELQRMANASMRVAQELQHQADQQRRAADRLFAQLAGLA